MKKIKVAINGANGRMGKAIQEVLKNDKECIFELVAQLTRDKKPEYNNADVIIDFSSNDGLLRLLDELEIAKEFNQTPKLISGTTGLSDETFKRLRQYSNRSGVIWGSNTSFGVNLMFAMVKKLGAVLHENEYDAEVYERHHRMKKDAPSGTALTIGKKIAEGRGIEFIKNDYSSFGERKTGEIGFAVERAGQTVGFHEARFIADDETIWFGHEAHDRSIFAKGAVKLAKITVEKDIKGYNEAWEILTDFI